MSADFWSGYVSGAIGILIGNPLDLIKTKIQAGSKPREIAPISTDVAQTTKVLSRQFEHWTALARGSAAPLLGYGALNALLFVTYNRSLSLLYDGSLNGSTENASAVAIWTAGALGGLATFFVSAPTELVKCRAQVSYPPRSSWEVTREMWSRGGIRSLYLGGGITAVRDSVGYGFYFWSYHLSRQAVSSEEDDKSGQAVKILLCGGLAGIATWASIFPLDVIKTRVQTWDFKHTSDLSSAQHEVRQLLPQATASRTSKKVQRPSTYRIAIEAYRSEGASVFFRGIGICCARAFIVNAVQWAVYEWMMTHLTK